MNTRERFLSVMNFEPADRTLMWELGYWAGAVRRWYDEGLPRRAGVPDFMVEGESLLGGGAAWDPERVEDTDVRDFFGLDKGLLRIPLNVYVHPRYEPKVLEDHGDWVLAVDDRGVTKKELKERNSLPHFVGWPVSNRDDWERIKAERFRPNLAERLPADWPRVREEMRQRDYPLAIGYAIGFFGTPRYLMGPENLLVAYIEQPELVRDIINYLCDFWIRLFDELLDQIDVDVAVFWEDMCYRSGPLISPAMFREFMLPAYKKMTSFLRDRGIKHITLDNDGDTWSLIPLFMEGGITGLYPFEVNGGMDVVAVRKAFPRLQMLGGIDKVQLAIGPEAIDAELESKVPSLLAQGGFVPYVDHAVPSDVSFANFAHYRRRLNDMIRSGGNGAERSS